MKTLALRLHPDLDLKQNLKNFAITHQIQAGFIVTAVGSLKQAQIRFANQPESVCFQNKYEIISLVGTLSIHGLHLHIALADDQGVLMGGHLDEGCLIYTTAEIVVGINDDLIFKRQFDPKTGFQELVIDPKL